MNRERDGIAITASRWTVLAAAVALAVAQLLWLNTAQADGTVTTPQNIAPTTWGVANVNMTAGLSGDQAGVVVTIYYFDGSSNLVKVDRIGLTAAEVVSFLTMTNSPVAGESGSVVKKYRMRVTKWLIDNNKITNVTPES